MRNELSRDALLFLAVVAIIVAWMLFLGYSYVQNRGATAAEGDGRLQRAVIVEDETITITYDPNQLVNIVPSSPDTGQPVAEQPTTEPQPVVPDPTAEPQPANPDPTQPPPDPTQPPPDPTQPAPTPVPQTNTPATGGASGVEPFIFINYTVVQGDTLFGITQKQNTSITLMAEQGIAQDDLSPGSVLSLPVANPAYCTGGTTPYVIREGDTAFSIASRNGISVDLLRQYNGSAVPDITQIDAGDVLCV